MTAKVDGPRYLKEGEFDSLAELLSICFGGMEVAEWPHVCRPESEYYDRYQVCSDGTRIVCSVAMVPMELYIEGATLSVAGISIVATHPDFRLQGLASSCIRAALAEAKRRGFAMAWLNGDRRRYRWFGFERAGRKYNFQFDKRSIGSLPPQANEADEILAYRGESSLVAGIANLYDRRELRGVRDLDLTRMLLSRKGTETTVAVRDGVVAGYLTAFGRPKDPAYAEVYEYGGDGDAFAALLRDRFDSTALERATMAAPILPDDARSIVYTGAAAWELGYSGWIASGGMAKVLDLRVMLDAFVPQMNRKRDEVHSTSKSAITIELEGSGQSATIDCDESITVTGQRSTNAVTIDEADLVRELFGMERTHHPALAASILGVVTPLDFYISPLEMV